LVLVGVTVFQLIDTERQYLIFVESLDDVEVELIWVDTVEEVGKITLRFEALFHNSSDLTMYVEALNTQLYINGKYAGAHHITESRHRVPPQGEQAVPLQAVLWERRAHLLKEAQASGGNLQVIGRARVRFETGGTSLKVFYDVKGTFELPAPFGVTNRPTDSKTGPRIGRE